MRRWGRRLSIAAAFAALVLALLWFQGKVLRAEPALAAVPELPRLAPDARTARVERVRVPALELVPGFVEAVEPAELGARVLASVLAVHVREGERVEQGALLVELDERDARARLAQAEAALAAASAQAVLARAASERVERLHAGGAATDEQQELARAARESADAGERRAREALDEARAALSWHRIEAPFAGRVLARAADPGQLAQPGRALVTLYREERLRFAAWVPAERAARLEPGARLRVAFDGSGEREAELTRVLPAVDPRTGTVGLQLALDTAPEAGSEPRPALRPGQLGRLALEVGAREALLVPAEAIERVGQLERVRLVREGRVERVSVRTAKRFGEPPRVRVEVLAGLAEGEQVVLP